MPVTAERVISRVLQEVGSILKRPVKPERVILRVLQEAGRTLGRPVTRTELVKLVYLLDYFYAQHSEGRSLTGLAYFWDNHGPNAIGNQIVKRADWMELKDGTIHIYEELIPTTGNSRFLYRADEDVVVQPIADDLAEELIRLVVREYGPLGWRDVTEFAKTTRPMRGINQGEPLDLRPDERTAGVVAAIRRKADSGAYDKVGPGVPLAELKRRYGPRAE